MLMSASVELQEIFDHEDYFQAITFKAIFPVHCIPKKHTIPILLTYIRGFKFMMENIDINSYYTMKILNKVIFVLM